LHQYEIIVVVLMCTAFAAKLNFKKLNSLSILFMPYKFSEQQQIQILEPDNLWIPEDNQKIIEEVTRLISEGKNNFVVNLNEVPYVNSIGLSFLISILTRARSAGGEVLIANVSDKIKQILLMTRLQAMFMVTNSVEEAVAHFSQLTKV
jgi:anti-sigma B factor antagonist